jgi:hypothetical protein
MRCLDYLHHLVFHWHRRVLGAIAISFFTIPATSQTELWFDKFGARSWDALLAGAPDGSGGTFVGGYSGQKRVDVFGFSPTNALLARYDAAGNKVWIRRFGSAGNASVQTAASDGLGGVFLSGTSSGGSSGSWTLPARWMGHFDSLGNDLWIGGQPTSSPAVHGAPDGAGGYFLCGTTGSGFGPDSWVARFDSTGNQIWSSQIAIDYTTGDEATAVVSDGQGGAFVCGFIWVWNFYDNAWLGRVDSTGQLLWSVKFVTPGTEYAYAVIRDDAGGVFVGGSTTGDLAGASQSAGGAWIGRFDGSGNEMWLSQPFSVATKGLWTMAPDGAGGVFAGVITSGAACLARFEGSGTLIYSQKVSSTKNATLGLMVSDGANGVYMGGGTVPGKYDAWLARYDGSCFAGRTYCTASITSIANCQAAISATGSPTLVDPTNHTISSGAVPGANLGLLLFGNNGPNSAPYGTLGGTLCVATPTFRTTPKLSGGDLGQCNGVYTFTLQDMINSSPIVMPGAEIHAQIWARDPENVDGFLLTNGLRFTVCP